MEKEKLEEAAEKFLIRQGCQRMDCDGEKCNFFEDVQPKDLIEFAKWQQERMYSEAIEFAEWIRIKDFQTTSKDNWIGLDMKYYTTEELFEQFNKK